MLVSIVILLVLAYLIWPYYQLNQLGRALDVNDEYTLRKCLDLDAIQRGVKGIVDKNIEGVGENYDNPVVKFLRGGVKELSGSALDFVDFEWVRDTLLGAREQPGARGPQWLGGFSFAFFEAPNLFLVRAGRLGENPVHLHMTLQNWRWRVTAVFV